MNKENTFIKVYRGIEDHWLWEDKPFSKGQAWIDLLIMANAADVKKPYKGEITTFKRGVVHRSVLSLAEKWGWSRHKVMDFLAVLEADSMITKNGTSNGTTITIENYNKYQDKPTTKGQQKDNERYNERTTKGQPADTIKNDKNDKNNNNKEREYRERKTTTTTTAENIPPSPQEVRAYCQENKLHVDPDKFMDYYTANGWKVGKGPMKSWKATIRNWERREKAYEHRDDTRESGKATADQRDALLDWISSKTIGDRPDVSD